MTPKSLIGSFQEMFLRWLHVEFPLDIWTSRSSHALRTALRTQLPFCRGGMSTICYSFVITPVL